MNTDFHFYDGQCRASCSALKLMAHNPFSVKQKICMFVCVTIWFINPNRCGKRWSACSSACHRKVHPNAIFLEVLTTSTGMTQHTRWIDVSSAYSFVHHAPANHTFTVCRCPAKINTSLLGQTKNMEVLTKHVIFQQLQPKIHKHICPCINTHKLC